MSSRIAAAADLAGRDEVSSSDGRTIAFEIIMSIMILFAVFILIVPPIVFLSPTFGSRWGSSRGKSTPKEKEKAYRLPLVVTSLL